MIEGLALGFGVVACTAGVSAVVLWLAHLTKPRPVKAPARQGMRKQWQPLPTVEAELFGGPSDGAIVAIPAHQPDSVIHRGQWYRIDEAGNYRYDGPCRLTRRDC
jgi:hypothetical protein